MHTTALNHFSVVNVDLGNSLVECLKSTIETVENIAFPTLNETGC